MEKPAGYAVFATTLNGWDTAALMEAADLVADLQRQPGYPVVQRVVMERRETELAGLVHGPVREHARYVEVTSRLSGLESSLTAADAIRYAAQERARSERETEEREHGGA